MKCKTIEEAPKEVTEIAEESNKSSSDEISQIQSPNDLIKKSYFLNVEVIGQMISDVNSRIDNMEYIMNVDLENQSEELNKKKMDKARGKVKRSNIFLLR